MIKRKEMVIQVKEELRRSTGEANWWPPLGWGDKGRRGSLGSQGWGVTHQRLQPWWGCRLGVGAEEEKWLETQRIQTL